MRLARELTWHIPQSKNAWNEMEKMPINMQISNCCATKRRASVPATVWNGWRQYFLSIYSPQLALNIRPTVYISNSIVRLCCCCCRCRCCYCWKSYCGQLTAATHTHTHLYHCHSAVQFCRVSASWRKRMEPLSFSTRESAFRRPLWEFSNICEIRKQTYSLIFMLLS